MISEALQRARSYITEQMKHLDLSAQPAFHVTGGVGWINDPNGFSVYKGEYHLFFQYYPYDTVWGPMHWGHVKTKDFVRWERLPVALAPDTEYDRDGCFSGSALELPDGRQLLMYTGVRKAEAPKEWQTQCLAIGDGVDYTKYDGNPVLDGRDVPPGGSDRDFRDPKLWREDGHYYAVAGNRAADGSGQILLFESEDALHWKRVGTLAECRNEYGRMWECPDFFPLDGTYILLTSPQEMEAEELEFHPGYGTICLSGRFDRDSLRLQRESIQAIDYGLDFYAPQTLETPDGRRIMIAWMQNWETVGPRRDALPFFGQMTIPRELRFRNGRLYQNPVRELAAYRGQGAEIRGAVIREETELPGVHGRVLDLTVTVRAGAGGTPYRSFTLKLARGEGRFTSLRYTPGEGILRMDRSHSGFPCDIVHTRDFRVREAAGALKLRVLLDRFSLEVFVNDGEAAASCVLFTPIGAEGVSFSAEGEALVDVECYPLML